METVNTLKISTLLLDCTCVPTRIRSQARAHAHTDTAFDTNAVKTKSTTRAFDSKPSRKPTARHMLSKTSCPFRDREDGDVPLRLWLEGSVTLGGCLSYSWGSPRLHHRLHRCCTSRPEYALKGSRFCPPTEASFKDNERQHCIIYSLLTVGIYCWLSAPPDAAHPPWISPSDI